MAGSSAPQTLGPLTGGREHLAGAGGPAAGRGGPDPLCANPGSHRPLRGLRGASETPLRFLRWPRGASETPLHFLQLGLHSVTFRGSFSLFVTHGSHGSHGSHGFSLS